MYCVVPSAQYKDQSENIVVVAYLRILKVISPCVSVRILKTGDFIMENKTIARSTLNWIFLAISAVFSLNH
jgi:hypothetical protein